MRSWGNISQPVGLWFFHSHTTHPSLSGEIQSTSLFCWAPQLGFFQWKSQQKTCAFPLKYYPSAEIFHLLWNYWFGWWWLCCLWYATHKYVRNCMCTIYMHTQEVSRNCFGTELLVSQLCRFWRNLCLKGERYGVTLSLWRVVTIFFLWQPCPIQKLWHGFCLILPQMSPSKKTVHKKIIAI